MAQGISSDLAGMIGVTGAAGSTNTPNNSGKGPTPQSGVVRSGGVQRAPVAPTPGQAALRQTPAAPQTPQGRRPPPPPHPMQSAPVQRQQPPVGHPASSNSAPRADPALPGRALAAADALAQRPPHLPGSSQRHGRRHAPDGAARAADIHARHDRAAREVKWRSMILRTCSMAVRQTPRPPRRQRQPQPPQSGWRKLLFRLGLALMRASLWLLHWAGALPH